MTLIEQLEQRAQWFEEKDRDHDTGLLLRQAAKELAEVGKLDSAEVVAFDGQERTIALRFDLMPCAAIGERWLASRSDRK